MAAFPDVQVGVSALDPLTEGLEYKTLTTQFEGGQESRKQKWLYPRRNFKINYKAVSNTDAQTLWQFYVDRAGSFESFSFFHPYSRSYVGEYVATGDGSTQLFSFPSKQGNARTIYINGSEETGGTFTQAGGSDGEDQWDAGSPIASGAIITYDFTGRLKVRCRFADDRMDYTTFMDRLMTVGLKIQGLLNS